MIDSTLPAHRAVLLASDAGRWHMDVQPGRDALGHVVVEDGDDLEGFRAFTWPMVAMMVPGATTSPWPTRISSMRPATSAYQLSRG